MADTITPERRDDKRTINAMIVSGGVFISNLARLAASADPDNLARIKQAFPQIWGRYAAIARQAHANKAG